MLNNSRTEPINPQRINAASAGGQRPRTPDRSDILSSTTHAAGAATKAADWPDGGEERIAVGPSHTAMPAPETPRKAIKTEPGASPSRRYASPEASQPTADDVFGASSPSTGADRMNRPVYSHESQRSYLPVAGGWPAPPLDTPSPLRFKNMPLQPGLGPAFRHGQGQVLAQEQGQTLYPTLPPSPTRFLQAQDAPATTSFGPVLPSPPKSPYTPGGGPTVPLAEEVLGALHTHNVLLDMAAAEDLRRVLGRHELRSEGFQRGRDISRQAIKRGENKIAELAARVRELEGRLAEAQRTSDSRRGRNDGPDVGIDLGAEDLEEIDALG